MHPRPVLPRAWLWACLFALLAAQTLGLAHRIVHAPQLSHLAQPAPVGAAARAHAHGGQQGAMAPLFSSHGEASDCRLYDQLGNGQAMPAVPMLALPAVVPFLVLQFFQGEAVARWAALFDARGPPPVR